MSANLENSAVATGLEKVSFHSTPKERQCQRIFKLSHNCTHLTQQQSNAQNSPSQASTIWTVNFQMFKLDLENSEKPEIRLPTSTELIIANIQHSLIIEKAREFQKNIYFCFIDYTKDFDCVGHNKLWKILKEMGIPDHLTCLLRNLYTGQIWLTRLELDMEQQTGSK